MTNLFNQLIHIRTDRTAPTHQPGRHPRQSPLDPLRWQQHAAPPRAGRTLQRSPQPVRPGLHPRGTGRNSPTAKSRLVSTDPAAQRFRLQPSTEGDPLAWRLSGSGTIQRRVKLTAFIKKFPHMAGEYNPGQSAHGIQLVKK